MPNQELLPGVVTTACPPPVVCDAHRAILAAKRRALTRDVMQLVLVAAVNVLFIYWADARLPMLDRAASLLFLTGVNLLVIAHLWLTRLLPRWSARRIASTWCRTERQRFSETEARRRHAARTRVSSRV
ncbi:MAG TPA: hypothetical protein VF701_22435 [Thermoanaerobaculia bacterium]